MYHWHTIARADMVCMALPCQSTSSAGRGRAGADPRDLWKVAADLLRTIRPPVAVFEVVPGFWKGGHRDRFLDEIQGT
eukprot:12987104-Alexandrium_andersonii.AAC.1